MWRFMCNQSVTSGNSRGQQQHSRHAAVKPVEDVQSAAAAVGDPVRQTQRRPLGLQDLDARVPAESARVVDGHAWWLEARGPPW